MSTTHSLDTCSNKIQKIFSMCAENCHKSDMANKHCAIITSAGKVVSIGYNHTRTRAKNLSCSQPICAIHAEIHALLKLINLLNRRSYYCHLKGREKGSCIL